MAGFHTKTFIRHDDYMTPKYAWDNIKHFIPKDKVIWEAFYGDGTSGTHLQELGFNVIHEPIDLMNRLLTIDKPFILLFPSAKINTGYFRKWKDRGLQIIIPRKRINFIKKIEGEIPENWVNNCNFDCFYYCYKMGLPNDIIWLE